MPSKKIEQRALKLIFEAGENGLFQSDLWKQLDISSRLGSRISKKLEEKNGGFKIERKRFPERGKK